MIMSRINIKTDGQTEDIINVQDSLAKSEYHVCRQLILSNVAIAVLNIEICTQYNLYEPLFLFH